MVDRPGRRGKGRPPAAPAPYPEQPIDEWLSGLSPTARHILDAAQRLLLSKGFEALTLEAVALEAGEDRGAIKRHFGTKSGLIQALFDYLGNDAFRDLTERIAPLSGDQRRHALIRSCSVLAGDRQLAQGMFELIPHAIRDPILRERLAALYAWYLATMREDSGIADALVDMSSYEHRRDAETLPAMVMATIDGISLQLSLDPTAVDTQRAFALLDLFVAAVLDGTLRTEGRLG